MEEHLTKHVGSTRVYAYVKKM